MSIINKIPRDKKNKPFTVTVADYSRASKVKVKILAACLNLKLLKRRE